RSAGLPGTGFGRVEVAVSPADPRRVFAALATSSLGGSLQGIYASADGGDTWTKVNSPDFCLGQCNYDLVVGAHPSDPTVFYAGGVTLRKFTGGRAAPAPMPDPNLPGRPTGV